MSALGLRQKAALVLLQDAVNSIAIRAEYALSEGVPPEIVRETLETLDRRLRLAIKKLNSKGES